MIPGSLATVIADGLQCSYRSVLTLTRAEFDRSLRGTPAFANCLIFGEGDTKPSALFVPQGINFDATDSHVFDALGSRYTLIFFDAEVLGIPTFGLGFDKAVRIEEIEGITALLHFISQQQGHQDRYLNDFLLNKMLEGVSVFVLRYLSDCMADVLLVIEGYFGNPRLVKLLQYIHANLKKDITLEDLGELTHLSPDYVSQFFKRCLGQSIQSYLIQQRVKLGLHMLVATQFNISEVSDMSGFIDQAYFNRRLKKMYGLNPLQIRKVYRSLQGTAKRKAQPRIAIASSAMA